MSEFTAGSLRELRLQAGLSQKELSRRSGIHWTNIWRIEKGKSKPRELTWRALLKALSGDRADEEQPAQEKEPASDFFGEVLLRDEFFRRLKMKMSGSVAAMLNDVLVTKLIEAAEFFSRTKFYPGDFSTAMEILGGLLRARRREQIGGCDVKVPGLKRKYKVRLPDAKRKCRKKR